MSDKPVDWQQLIDATDDLIKRLSLQGGDRQMLEDLGVLDGVDVGRLLPWLRQLNAIGKMKAATSGRGPVARRRVRHER